MAIDPNTGLPIPEPPDILGPPEPFEREFPESGDPIGAFQSPGLPGISIPGVTTAIPAESVQPKVSAGVLARAAAILRGGSIVAVLIEIGNEIIAEIQEKEFEDLERERDEERRALRELRTRTDIFRDLETLPAEPRVEPVRRAPQPVFTPARPQRVDLPDIIAEPLPDLTPPEVKPSVPTPAPIELPPIPAPTLPRQTPLPAPAPATRPGTRPTPAPGPLPGIGVPLPIGLPLPRILPFTLPSVRPRVRPFVRPTVQPRLPVLPSPLTPFETGVLPSVQPAPTTAGQCPPCPRCRRPREEPEEPREECFKKLVKEGLFPSLDEAFQWVEIDCLTGREL